MTIDWTKPIETVEGKPARILVTDLEGDARFAVAFMSSTGKYELLNGFNEYQLNQRFRNKPVKREGWIGIRPPGGSGTAVVGVTTNVYGSAEEVRRNLPDDALRAFPWSVVRVEWEETP